MPFNETTEVGTTSRSIETIRGESLRTAVRVTARMLLDQIDRLDREVYDLAHLPKNPAEDYIRSRRIDHLNDRVAAFREAASILAGSLQLNGWQNLRDWLVK